MSMRAESGWLKGLNPTVAIVSEAVIIVFVPFAALVALVLLSVGGGDGLKALQTASITVALPFSFIMLVMVYGLIKALRAEIAMHVRQ